MVKMGGEGSSREKGEQVPGMNRIGAFFGSVQCWAWDCSSGCCRRPLVAGEVRA